MNTTLCVRAPRTVHEAGQTSWPQEMREVSG
jgi:hypothetical protein